MCGATNVLEIGTFTGYATMSLVGGGAGGAGGAGGGGNKCHVTTLEIDSKAADVAAEYINKYGYAADVDIIVNPALESISSLIRKINSGILKPFDFVFVDADKRGYKSYHDILLTSNLLTNNATIVYDNVLFKGLVLNSPCSDKLNYWKRRHQDIADDLHEFNCYINNDERVNVVVLPIRDGLSICKRI
jgi:predicted O-methyltransferase YrrM